MSALSEIVTRTYRRFAQQLARNLAGVEVPADRLGSLVATADCFPAGDVLVSVELIVFRPDTWPQFADWTARQVIGEPHPITGGIGPTDVNLTGTRAEVDHAVAMLRERTTQMIASRPRKITSPDPDRYAVTVTVVEW